MQTECNEFTVGFCTKTAFKIDGLTQECLNFHNNLSKINYEKSNILMGFESEVLQKYTKLIDECNLKIKNNNFLIETTETEEEARLDEIIEKVDYIFERNPTNYNLLKLYSELVKKKKIGNFDTSCIKICKICGAFYRKENKNECEHFMHESYQKLREITQKLYEKINYLK
ncbi:hypothetical protein GVAV_000694 [Gurleya vavrai]